MTNCTACNTLLINDAHFCHVCGKKNNSELKLCKSCNCSNVNDARFCTRCGSPISVTISRNNFVSPVYGLDFNDIRLIPYQLYEAFRLTVSLSLELENNFDKEKEFQQLLENSNFRKVYLDKKLIQITREYIELFEERGVSSFNIIESDIEKNFLLLIEYFFIHYCNDLLPDTLSQNILNHQYTIKNTTDQNLVPDYLNNFLNQNNVYIKKDDIPSKLINNARGSYYKSEFGSPLLLIDISLTGNAKEGIILTNEYICWKANFHKSAFIQFNEVDTIKFMGDHILINNIYLNAGKTLNYSFYRLLVRLIIFN